ncbi:MAG: ABC transporter permease [Lachnospiraceae bacterium]|nr:ABC transporter permease [Lachnospiraceae bacterium]
MRLSSILYSIRQGVKNIKRNLLFSLASVGTIVSCLFLFGVFYCVVENFRASMEELENTVVISVFFDEGISEENKSLIGEQIRLREEVNTMDYISPEEAWENYARDTYKDNYELAMESFAGDNPLKNSDSYEITLKDLDKHAEFVQYLKELHGVRKVASSEQTADGVSALSSIVTYASIAIIAILLLVSVFLINNTITIGITVRKDEIGVMKLIGATNMFVRAPFVVEGIIIGLVGSMVPVGLVYIMYDKVVEYLVSKQSIVQNLFAFVPAGDIFKVLVPASVVIGLGLGLVGSMVATRKHLKV